MGYDALRYRAAFVEDPRELDVASPQLFRDLLRS
jgi:hypothetical protein